MLKKTFTNDVNLRCKQDKCYFDHNVSVAQVKACVVLLKQHKHDCSGEYSSNHIILGPEKLHVLLFKGMLVHGYCSKNMLSSVIFPIPKNRKHSLNDSNNYRGIALGCLLGKLFDLIILHINKQILTSCYQHFGFKVNHPTTQCSFVLTEIIQYYKNKHTDIYVVFLDASKAFDKIQYIKLCKVLHNKGLCPLICRLLAFMYTYQSVCIKWGKVKSDHVFVSNGEKQGGILSPILFTLYMDILFLKLKEKRIGCFIGDMFLGAIGYVDHIALLAPSISALKQMLKICDEFAAEYSVTFNIEKFQLIHYARYLEIHGIKHNGIFIKCHDYVNHLGHVIGLRSEKELHLRVTKKFISRN